MMQVATNPSLPQHSENVEEELHTIREALNALYSPQLTNTLVQTPPSPSSGWLQNRPLVDHFLSSFQRTVTAWRVCDRILCDTHSPANTTEDLQLRNHRFFAAQTLHSKCQVHFHELSGSSANEFKASMIAHLSSYSSSGDNALKTQLALCIAALSIQMCWDRVVPELLGNIQQSQQRQLAMEVLRVLPEECCSDRLLVEDENVRYHMRETFVSNAPTVFQFIIAWDGPQFKALEVFQNWILIPMPPEMLVTTPLLEATFRAMTGLENLEKAADTIVAILKSYPSHHTCNDALVRKMTQLVAGLPMDDALRCDDQDVLRAYCRVITEMGESYMSLILSSDASQLVNWVVRCSAIPDTDVSNMTLDFWYSLVVALEAIEPFGDRQIRVDQYSGQLQQLVEICCGTLMKYTDDEDIERHRGYVAETVDDCCRLLGGQHVLHTLGVHLKKEYERIGVNIMAEWQSIEATLACICAASRYIPSDDTTGILAYCFEIVPRLPFAITVIRSTTTKLIGKTAAWLAYHPETLATLYPLLTESLTVPECSKDAAIALRQLCQHSTQQMFMIQPVLTLYKEIGNNAVRLDIGTELEILQGLCQAVSRHAVQVLGGARDYIPLIVEPIGTRLSVLASAPSTNNTRLQMLDEIEKLTVVVQHLKIPGDQNPAVEIVTTCWPLLETIMNSALQDSEVGERICRFHKHALRNSSASAYAPLVDPLIQLVIQSYERSHISAYLYLASVLIGVYGVDNNYSQKLYGMIESMARTSFTFLRNLNDITQYPLVVEELFYLMCKMISKSPDVLLTSPILPALFQCATVSMQVQHRNANKATLNFLEVTFEYGRAPQNRPESRQALEAVIVSNGQKLVQNLALALLGDLPAYFVDSGSGSIPGVLWSLNALKPDLVYHWLAASLNTAPPQEKNSLLEALSKDPQHSFNSSVRGFMSACSRYRRVAQVRGQ